MHLSSIVSVQIVAGMERGAQEVHEGARAIREGRPGKGKRGITPCRRLEVLRRAARDLANDIVRPPGKFERPTPVILEIVAKAAQQEGSTPCMRATFKNIHMGISMGRTRLPSTR